MKRNFNKISDICFFIGLLLIIANTGDNLSKMLSIIFTGIAFVFSVLDFNDK